MEQTFRKSVAGKYYQFNRLLYPLRYLIKSDEDGSDGNLVEFRKDDDGAWKPVKDEIDKWFKEELEEINVIISQNEINIK